MILQAANHFMFGISVLASGIPWDWEHEKFRHYGQLDLSEYPRDSDSGAIVSTPEPRVQFWVRTGVPVWVADVGIIWMGISVFTEFTTAADMVEQMRLKLHSIDRIKELFERQKPEGAPESQVTPEKVGSAPPPQNLSNPVKPRVPADAAHTVIAPFDFRAIEDYEKQFAGQEVIIPVYRLAHERHIKRDGGEFVSLDVYPDGCERDQGKLRIYMDERDNNYDLKKARSTGMLALVPNVGDARSGSFFLQYKINPSKTGDKVFWNFTGFHDAANEGE